MTIPLFHRTFDEGFSKDAKLLVLETMAVDETSNRRPDIWVYVHRDERYEFLKVQRRFERRRFG